MSAQRRDETSVFRHAGPGCVVCGASFDRAASGRRRIFCGAACRQHAYRLRVERRGRREVGLPADPAEVTRLLAAVLGMRRRR